VSKTSPLKRVYNKIPERGETQQKQLASLEQGWVLCRRSGGGLAWGLVGVEKGPSCRGENGGAQENKNNGLLAKLRFRLG